MPVSKIVGLDKLIAKLNVLGGNVDKALEKGLTQAAKQVQATAKELCPRDTGQLVNSIYSKTERRNGQLVGIVGTNCEYACYLEFGTGQRGAESPSPPKDPKNVSYRMDWIGIRAQPYLYPAFTSNKANIQRILEKNLLDEIKRLGG